MISYGLVEDVKNKTMKLTLENEFKFFSGKNEEVVFKDKEGNSLIITSDWETDCCEYNYIAGEGLKDTLITELEAKEFLVEFIDHFGIKINGNPIPCYTEQNGYYTGNVNLTFTYITSNDDEQQLYIRGLECKGLCED